MRNLFSCGDQHRKKGPRHFYISLFVHYDYAILIILSVHGGYMKVLSYFCCGMVMKFLKFLPLPLMLMLTLRAMAFGGQAQALQRPMSVSFLCQKPNMGYPYCACNAFRRGESAKKFTLGEKFGAGTEGAGSSKERYWTMKRDLSLSCAPYIVMGGVLHTVKHDVRKVQHDLNYGFRNKVDDYLQYAPLAFTYVLKATGYQGRSQWGRLLVSNAFSAVIMAGLVNSIKYAAAEERPDGSARNSFPSGHTATAFMAATILHKEYGLTRSLWYSFGGYTVATGIGVFRVMNNRHWVSDVMMGAGIGILSTELGYALTDLIFKDKYTLRREMEGLDDVAEHPSFFSLQAGAGFSVGRGSKSSIITADGAHRFDHGVSSVIAAEAAYFLTPQLGIGLRSRIVSTAVRPLWSDAAEGWTYGTLHYDTQRGLYQHTNVHAAEYRQGNYSEKDKLSNFDVMGGIYGHLPLSRRMSLGAKILVGYRQSGDLRYWSDLSGCSGPDKTDHEGIVRQMVEYKNDITTYDRIRSINLNGKASFIVGTGISFSYALKHNTVWRACLDYDFSPVRYEYEYRKFSMTDRANHILSAGSEGSEGSMEKGQLHRGIHQITPSFAICFSF